MHEIHDAVQRTVSIPHHVDCRMRTDTVARPKSQMLNFIQFCPAGFIGALNRSGAKTRIFFVFML